MDQKLYIIKKQAKVWTRLAFIIPVVFLAGSGLLYHLNMIGEHNIFLVVLIGWTLIAVSWWFWTMITITFLARMMIKSNNDLVDIKEEVKAVRNEIS